MFLLNEFYSVSMEGDIINVALFKEMDLSFVDMPEHLQCNNFFIFFFSILGWLKKRAKEYQITFWINPYPISPYIPSALFFQNYFNDLDPTKNNFPNMDTLHLIYFYEFVHVWYMHYINGYVLS